MENKLKRAHSETPEKEKRGERLVRPKTDENESRNDARIQLAFDDSSFNVPDLEFSGLHLTQNYKFFYKTKKNDTHEIEVRGNDTIDDLLAKIENITSECPTEFVLESKNDTYDAIDVPMEQMETQENIITLNENPAPHRRGRSRERSHTVFNQHGSLMKKELSSEEAFKMGLVNTKDANVIKLTPQVSDPDEGKAIVEDLSYVDVLGSSSVSHDSNLIDESNLVSTFSVQQPAQPVPGTTDDEKRSQRAQFEKKCMNNLKKQFENFSQFDKAPYNIETLQGSCFRRFTFQRGYSLIGGGGFGLVFLAKDNKTKKTVALKFQRIDKDEEPTSAASELYHHLKFSELNYFEETVPALVTAGVMTIAPNILQAASSAGEKSPQKIERFFGNDKEAVVLYTVAEYIPVTLEILMKHADLDQNTILLFLYTLLNAYAHTFQRTLTRANDLKESNVVVKYGELFKANSGKFLTDILADKKLVSPEEPKWFNKFKETHADENPQIFNFELVKHIVFGLQEICTYFIDFGSLRNTYSTDENFERTKAYLGGEYRVKAELESFGEVSGDEKPALDENPNYGSSKGDTHAIALLASACLTRDFTFLYNPDKTQEMYDAYRDQFAKNAGVPGDVSAPIWQQIEYLNSSRLSFHAFYRSIAQFASRFYPKRVKSRSRAGRKKSRSPLPKKKLADQEMGTMCCAIIEHGRVCGQKVLMVNSVYCYYHDKPFNKTKNLCENSVMISWMQRKFLDVDSRTYIANVALEEDVAKEAIKARKADDGQFSSNHIFREFISGGKDISREKGEEKTNRFKFVFDPIGHEKLLVFLDTLDEEEQVVVLGKFVTKSLNILE